MPKRRVRTATRRPDSRRKRCSAASSGSTRPLHLQPHHRPDFHRTTIVGNRTPGRQLGRLVQIPGLDDGEAADDVLGLRVGPVGHRLRLPGDDLARVVEWLADVLEVALITQILEPRPPLLHRLLRPFGRTGRLPDRFRGVSVQEHEFRHGTPSSSRTICSTYERLRDAETDISTQHRHGLPPVEAARTLRSAAASNPNQLEAIRPPWTLRCFDVLKDRSSPRPPEEPAAMAVWLFDMFLLEQEPAIGSRNWRMERQRQPGPGEANGRPQGGMIMSATLKDAEYRLEQAEAAYRRACHARDLAETRRAEAERALLAARAQVEALQANHGLKRVS